MHNSAYLMIRHITSLFLLIVVLFGPGLSMAQTASTPINYQVRYDEPYNVKKLFAHFQPLYGEVASSNMSIGFGVEFDYFLENKMDFSLQFRKSYGQATDLMRDAAIKNAENIIKPRTYKYFELGGTYHWRDFEEENPTKVFLYKKQFKGTALSSHVIETTEVISKVRKIYGARLGGFLHTTTFDLNRAMEKQSTVLVDSEGNTIDTDASLFGNLSTTSLYLGASMTWIRNFAIDFEEEFEPGGDDLLLTTFFDFLIAPSVNVDDILYNDVTYSSNSLKKSNIGFRLGAEGKFNRELGWGYGVEIGLRPGVSNQGFFSVLKLSFPLYSTDLDYSKAESEEMEETEE
jgi:hypothetical protein